MEQPKTNTPTEFLTLELVFQILIKRRWFIIIPLMTALIAGSVLAVVLPKKYEAQTLIIVEGQSVPTDYVRSLVDEGVGERLATMSQQILSRTNLEKIIEKFQLYQSPDKDGMFMEDKVNALRENITVAIASDQRRRATNAFTIHYKGTEPQRVMEITNALASFFIEENLKAREAQATGTSNFLEEELKNLRDRLEEKEQAVKQFRTENMGVLPEQLETNLRILDRLQNELSGRQQSLRDAKARLATLQSLPMAQSQEAGADPMDINQLRAELARMQTRYTDKHPDIIRLKQQIKNLEENPPEPAKAAYSGNPLVTEARIEIGNLEADIARIQNQIREYEQRVEEIPEREQELLTLQRDYQNLSASYNTLLGRKREAEMAVNLERKQKGEQFRIIDRARVPKRPIEPDMKKLFVGTVLMGFGLGCALIFALEFFNKPFRSVQEMQLVSGLPTLAMIPMIESAKTRFLKKTNWVLTGFFILATLAVLVVFSLLTLKGSDTILALASQIKASFMN